LTGRSNKRADKKKLDKKKEKQALDPLLGVWDNSSQGLFFETLYLFFFGFPVSVLLQKTKSMSSSHTNFVLDGRSVVSLV
jgi:hypothetical protein